MQLPLFKAGDYVSAVVEGQIEYPNPDPNPPSPVISAGEFGQTLKATSIEFSASLMVRSARTQVIGSVMYDMWAGGVYSQVAVLALIMVVVTVVGVCIAAMLGCADPTQTKG